MTNLRALCADAGLLGSDADTAIAHYLRVGALAGQDLAHARAASPEEREVFLYARYGSDGARVAAIVTEAYRVADEHRTWITNEDYGPSGAATALIVGALLIAIAALLLAIAATR